MATRSRNNSGNNLWPFAPLRRHAFDVVMFDPPWQFDRWSATTGIAKSPDAHYRCMSLDQIAALPVADLLDPAGDRIVWVWTTWPMLAAGHTARVLEGLHLVGKTGGDWAKRTRSGALRWGPGFIFRSVLEPFIVATVDGKNCRRGRRLINLIETAGAELLNGLAREHSRKPDEAYRLLERLAPRARRADIFACQRRRGWSGWGDQLDKYPPERGCPTQVESGTVGAEGP